MHRSGNSIVRIDLAKVRANAVEIIRRTGVPLIAVVKADAYGLGAVKVAEAIGDVASGFYVFDLAEAVAARLHEVTGKETIALLGESNDPGDYLAQKVRPVVWTVERAAALRAARPVLSIDTGQQRFACPANHSATVAEAGDCSEAMTHASKPDQAQQLVAAIAELRGRDGKNWKLHAAGSALLDEPAAWLDGVRLGLALYQDAVRVTARLVDARDSAGPAGYTGFRTARFGVILRGYSQGLRTGPCRVNGMARKILEVGMQSAFVELGSNDHVGDEVVLLGEDLQLGEIAAAWQTSRQEVLFRLTTGAEREWVS